MSPHIRELRTAAIRLVRDADGYRSAARNPINQSAWVVSAAAVGTAIRIAWIGRVVYSAPVQGLSNVFRYLRVSATRRLT